MGDTTTAGGAGRLAGQTALVTGSTRGIGRVVAETLAREGCAVVVSGRAYADAERTAAEIAGLGGRTWAVAADLSRLEDAHRLGQEAIRLVGTLDILVNNAGMSIRSPFWDVSDADWDYQVNVNYRSPFVLAQHAARQMRERAIRGRIVNTSTIGVHRCHADAAVYDSAKAAVEAMTRNLAWELGPAGITVNCVVPGPIAERPGAAEAAAFWQNIKPYVAVGRLGSAADVAAAVLFFCLPEAAFVTGQALLVDGGYGAPLAENYP